MQGGGGPVKGVGRKSIQHFSRNVDVSRVANGKNASHVGKGAAIQTTLRKIGMTHSAYLTTIAKKPSDASKAICTPFRARWSRLQPWESAPFHKVVLEIAGDLFIMIFSECPET